jgi:dTDP-4-amino-4,6-dideoxygalactose transaminase
MTTSCTDAMEMAAILIDTKAGDEIIMPSYTFVSTANAFVLRGAKIVFADSGDMNPNMDISKIEKLITSKTKAIVVMHYGGIAGDMDEVLRIANKYNLFVIEDAAQSIDSYYRNKPLGSLGHLSAFSFHETKNVISGEGGMLIINDSRFIKRAEIIREKGTNRAAFFRGEVDKYSWVDIGSSFLPSELISAFLFAQLESLDRIQNKRKKLWNKYNEALSPLEARGLVRLPFLPDYASNNAHLFYIICRNLEERTDLINFLKGKGIGAVFHYLSLHSSEYYKKYYKGGELTNTKMYSDCLLRLPMYFNLKLKEADFVCKTINSYFMK